MSCKREDKRCLVLHLSILSSHVSKPHLSSFLCHWAVHCFLSRLCRQSCSDHQHESVFGLIWGWALGLLESASAQPLHFFFFQRLFISLLWNFCIFKMFSLVPTLCFTDCFFGNAGTFCFDMICNSIYFCFSPLANETASWMTLLKPVTRTVCLRFLWRVLYAGLIYWLSLW